ncbi:MAG: hypothetical protein V3V97_11995 [Hyphomicrobiaceae bacterium]
MRVATLLSALLLAGCGTDRLTLSQTYDNRLSGKTIAVVVGRAPEFRLMAPPPRDADYRIAEAASEPATPPSDTAHAYGIADPGRIVAASLSNSLSKGLQLRIVDDPSTADYILNVTTFEWGMKYKSLATLRYYVHYSAIAKLIDRKSNETIERSSCMNVDNGAPDGARSTHKGLLEKDAAALKEELDGVAKRCSGELAGEVFG